MSFDQKTRNLLQRTVSACRKILDEEFAAQRRGTYGINDDGSVAPLETLAHLPDEDMQTAKLLRGRLDHLIAGLTAHGKKEADARKEAVGRLTRELAFTVLNRLAALRMAEERGIVLECVRHGLQSEGFLLFQQSAGGAFGDSYHSYRAYLFVLFDELSIDLGSLFSRWDPAGLLFPGPEALEAVLHELNGSGSAAARDNLTPDQFNAIWSEDETIGWIYQYYNDPAERKKMRDESAAPRNSREMAVRNQFFTPRYVVEFLTDNSLGRLWHEMTKGKTSLKDRCRYLIRRPCEFFLPDPDRCGLTEAYQGRREMFTFWRTGNVCDLPENPDVGVVIDWLCRLRQSGFEHELEIVGTDHQTIMDRWYGPIEQGNPPAELADLHPAILMQLLWRVGVEIERHGYDDMRRPVSEDVLASHFWLALRQQLLHPPEGLSQEDTLKRPIFVPHRPLKDPREIRIIDPACGSMHFGLYAFDLLEVIYQEAWDVCESSPDHCSLITDHSLAPLTSLYASKEEFMRDIPRMIIEHNIHGVDIDPRATQIAGLSLWLRAQRAWAEQGIPAEQRPVVRRSQIVCAEPMPGEKELLREFVEQEFPLGERAVFLPLLESVFDLMQLAGEAGSLLQIEEDIRSAIAEAKLRWKATPRTEQIALFDEETTPASTQEEMALDLSGITDEEFWEKAEERIYDSLRTFAESAGGGYQRRIFAEDAARGFAFIDLCRQRYDVVVMNPPFGEFSLPFRDIASTRFAGGSNDIITAFVERGAQLKVNSGFIGVISSRTVFYAPTSANWRKKVASREGVTAFVELGGGVLDGAMVEVCMYVMGGNKRGSSLFIRPKTSEGEVVLTNLYAESGAKVYVISLNAFEALDGMPFAYWLDDQVFWCLNNLPRLEECGLKVRVGLQTGDDFRFIRLWTEVPSDGLASQWFPHAKGGENSPFYTDIHLVVSWKDGGNEIKAQPSVRLNMYSGTNPDLYLAPGMTFSYRTNRFSPAALPRETITGVAGMGVFAKPPELTCGLAFLNSSSVNEFISARLGLLEINALYQAGTVQPTPYPNFTNEQRERLTELGNKLIRLVRGYLIAVETSRLFGFQSATSKSSDRSVVEGEIVGDYETIDEIVAAAYGFDSQAAVEICTSGQEEFRSSIRSLLSSCSVEISDQLAYALGCAFGRWDIRYATGERAAPEPPDPFDPLPVCPPGMLQNAAGLPAAPADVPASYPVPITWSGILVDDANHPDDIERRLCEVLAVIFPDRTAAIVQEACDLLGVKSLREWTSKPVGLFADHLKRYSKSRRQAPIYWPLSTASGSYTLWIYYHRLTPDTLYKCLSDFVEPKIAEVEKEIHRLRTMIAAEEAGTRERKQLADAESLLNELREFHADLTHWAPRWKPNLNDGVQITASPLWKLFRLPKWQKTLKETWQKLEKGDYDWAHLAHTLWPDRVREKCKHDRSLAIAHDLEDLCEIQAPVPKKKAAKKAAKKKGKVKVEENNQPELLGED